MIMKVMTVVMKMLDNWGAGIDNWKLTMMLQVLTIMRKS